MRLQSARDQREIVLLEILFSIDFGEALLSRSTIRQPKREFFRG